MRYIPSIAIVTLSVLALTISSPIASAFETLTPTTDSGNVVLETNATINDTVFGTGQDVDIRGTIEHDAFLAGKTVSVHQRIGNNLFIAGETVLISGHITGDVFAAGQRVVIDQNAVVDGDIAVAGGTIQIDGDIAGNVHVYGTDVSLLGRVGKTMTIGATTLKLGSSATVLGDLTGSISEPLSQATGAVIQGQTTLDHQATSMMRHQRESGVGIFFGLLFTFIMVIVGGLLGTMLAPTVVERVRAQMQQHSLQAGLIGLVTLLVSLPLFFLLLLLVVTLPLAFVELSVFATIMMVGQVAAMTWLGDKASMTVNKKQLSALGALAVGAVIYLVLGLIPLIGALAGFVALCVGVGAILTDIWQHYLQSKN